MSCSEASTSHQWHSDVGKMRGQKGRTGTAKASRSIKTPTGLSKRGSSQIEGGEGTSTHRLP
eukprot:12916727-Prorocentrum_lima.AAC.1